ncbi:hypothetical protein LCGC14_1025940 [marine sediment metagenome]|uniref:Uncharacterized protein n=1 Tax=marine sediment metagenome TaxID=412755 RepID=A0A0F9MW19_9ZZZZ
MGSEVLEAFAEQKGNVETNPAGLIPDVSRPIEQLATPFSTNDSTSKPIQQRLQTKTAPNGHDNPASVLSRPIEQLGEFKFARDFPDTDKAHALVQEGLYTANHQLSDSDVKPKTPIQQMVFVQPDNLKLDSTIPSTKPIQQVDTNTSGDSFTRPIEQVPRIQNTIQITQFDFIDLIFPPCDSIKNAVSTNILWRIKDFGFPFDVSSLIFTVQGIEVQDRSEFVITDLPTGLQIFYDPPEDFDFDVQVTVSITVDDTADPPNTFFVPCSWQTVPDVRPPFFRSVLPACNSTNVDVFSQVSFDVLDFGQGVDPDSIRLSIEGVTVCSGVTLDPIVDQDFTTISGIPVGAEVTGYHVTYDHPLDPWRYGSNVTISMEASDLSPLRNRVLFVCAFEVEESAAPEFFQTSPEPCDSFVDNRTGLTFEVYGVEHGIDISTLEVRVDNTLRKVFVRSKILRTE